MRRNQKAERGQMTLPGLAGISMEMPAVPVTPATDEIGDDYLTAILVWGESHGYEPRIAAPRHAGELLRIVMDRPAEEGR